MANTQPVYRTPVDITISLASVASSGTWIAGRESTVVSEITDRNIDEIISGQITVGTSPTANTVINIYAWAQTDDTPSYPSVGSATLLTGADAAATFTSADARQNACRLAANIFVPATTSNVPYPIPPFSLLALFGGVALPRRWGLFVAHNTGVILNATAGNHKIQRTPVYYETT